MFAPAAPPSVASTPRAARRARVAGAVAAALLFPALAAAELAGKPGCGALAAVYRSLEQSDAVSAAERRRITALILDACAVTEVRLARAATLDGVPVLEMPLRELRGGERRP